METWEASALKSAGNLSETCENGSIKTTFPSGTIVWTKDGKPHRLDGPAKEYIDGDIYWWIEGEFFTKEYYDQLIQEVKDMPLVLRLVDPRKWVREFK